MYCRIKNGKLVTLRISPGGRRTKYLPIPKGHDSKKTIQLFIIQPGVCSCLCPAYAADTASFRAGTRAWRREDEGGGTARPHPLIDTLPPRRSGVTTAMYSLLPPLRGSLQRGIQGLASSAPNNRALQLKSALLSSVRALARPPYPAAQCIAVCPTGALSGKGLHVRGICSHCRSFQACDRVQDRSLLSVPL